MLCFPLEPTSPDPESLLLQKQQQEHLTQAFNTLPLISRHLLDAMFVEGLRREEAANRLGLSLTQASRRRHEALRHLRRCLEEQEAPPQPIQRKVA